ncbi:MAG: 4-(cytidine 5'-diphospho)-2-C-methyl-D-erythritol kinase [Hyphomicrobiaceae bacterium]|nr:4-(cytidine 5'-diphospho)-2-C-methyl-D-erythritol kinase [Hyphomicrobiaceae bacterium]
MPGSKGQDTAGGAISELARAKVNLTLKVLGRRPDGYHELESLVAFADIGDVVVLTVGSAPEVTSNGPFGAGIEGENLVARALRELAQAEPRFSLGSIAIEKKLPVTAGFGGGSADAAAALRAVRRANPALAAAFDWHRLAARLGADVPVCLADTASLMWGIGEKIRPVRGLPRLPAVLANPGVPVPPDKTREVFRRLAAPAAPARSRDPGPLPPFVGLDDCVVWLRASGNDLAAPARDLMPACRAVEAALAASSGCRLVRMSGAGPACFGLFDTRQAAGQAASALSQSHPGWWVRAVTLA